MTTETTSTAISRRAVKKLELAVVAKVESFEEALAQMDLDQGTNLSQQWADIRGGERLQNVCMGSQMQTGLIGRICGAKTIAALRDVERLTKELEKARDEAGDAEESPYFDRTMKCLAMMQRNLADWSKTSALAGQQLQLWHRERRYTKMTEGNMVPMQAFGEFVSEVKSLLKQYLGEDKATTALVHLANVVARVQETVFTDEPVFVRADGADERINDKNPESAHAYPQQPRKDKPFVTVEAMMPRSR